MTLRGPSRLPRLLRRVFPVLVCAAIGGLLLAVSGPAAADVVHLKAGEKVEGKVISQTDKIVRFRTTAGRVRVFRMVDVERVEIDGEAPPGVPEDPAAPPAGVSEAGRKADADTQVYETQIGFKLKCVVKPHVVVRGDHDGDEIQRIADTAELTVLHFLDTFDVEASEVLRPGRRYDGGRIDVFRFRQEKGYRRFMDKVFDPIRDFSVNDERFQLMRRQRGFWIYSPQPVIAGFQGPSPVERTIAAVSHNCSHLMLYLYEHAPTWMPWWYMEGFATWQEIQVTGDNLTYCMDLTGAGDYVREGGPDADELAKSKTEKLWKARVKVMIADDSVRDLRVLGRLKLNELNLPEVIQSWSVVSWIAGKGKLKPFTVAYKRTRDLNTAFEESLGFGVEEAFETWKTWAK